MVYEQISVIIIALALLCDCIVGIVCIVCIVCEREEKTKIESKSIVGDRVVE